MAKTLPPGIINVPKVGDVVVDAVPDVFDGRDLEYRSRLDILPARMDCRDEAKKDDYILLQVGNSCTGHAVATVVNTIQARLRAQQQPKRRKRKAEAGDGTPDEDFHSILVSPYMIYALARRYDEFEGEDDIGSSLRGAFKGWFHHGLARLGRWPDMECQQDLNDPDFIAHCRDMPLGAFYRVNPFHLDDMQSAITELNAIAVSSAIHEGWLEPVPYENKNTGEMLYVIERQDDPQPLGGHAYALVGYNEVGFLVQNSWGKEWGKNGFATLTYEDWLNSAYDAWVARPGVPQTPFATGRQRQVFGPGGKLFNTPGPDLNRLAHHVVSLGNDGRLSAYGKFSSTIKQVDGLFQRMEEQHKTWVEGRPGHKRHIVFYAHGGMVSETAGLERAQKHLNWWLNNQVYPVYFAWQSGPVETLVNQLADLTRGRRPVGATIDILEQLDRLVEMLARSQFRWAWDQMKENARLASLPDKKYSPQGDLHWPLRAGEDPSEIPGGRLVVARLKAYVEQVGAENVALHLVGHSAGSIFLACFLEALAEAGLKVESLSYLAPGIRVDEFHQRVYPRLVKKDKPGGIQRMAIFNLNEQAELDDTCSVAKDNFDVYFKSLLYMVSRALEKPSDYHRRQKFEIPLLGMMKFFAQPLKDDSPETLQQLLTQAGVHIVPTFAGQRSNGAAGNGHTRSGQAVWLSSTARHHGGFDDDAETLESVLKLALDTKSLTPQMNFREDAELLGADALSAAQARAEAERQRASTQIPSYFERRVIYRDMGMELRKRNQQDKKAPAASRPVTPRSAPSPAQPVPKSPVPEPPAEAVEVERGALPEMAYDMDASAPGDVMEPSEVVAAEARGTPPEEGVTPPSPNLTYTSLTASNWSRRK